MKNNSLRWIGFLTGVVVFTTMTLQFVNQAFFGSTIGGEELLFAILIILPSLIISMLALFKKFWGILPFGVWYLFWGFVFLFLTSSQYKLVDVLSSTILLVSSLITIFLPFINQAVFLVREGEDESEEKRKPDIELRTEGNPARNSIDLAKQETAAFSSSQNKESSIDPIGIIIMIVFIIIGILLYNG